MENKDKKTIVKTIGEPFGILHNHNLDIEKWLDKHIGKYEILDSDKYVDIPIAMFIDDKGDAVFRMEWATRNTDKITIGDNVFKEEDVILDTNKIGIVKEIPVSITNDNKVHGWIKLNNDNYEPIEFINKKFKYEKANPNQKVRIKYLYYDKNVKSKTVTTDDIGNNINKLGLKNLNSIELKYNKEDE